MIEISFLFGELVFAAIWLIIRAALWIYRKRIDWKREAMLLLMYVNLAVMIRVTFYPFRHNAGYINQHNRQRCAVYSERNHPAYTVQEDGSFLEGAGGRCVYLAVH